MRMPAHAIRAQIIGPQPELLEQESGLRDWTADLRLFALTYAAGFLAVSLFIA